MRTSAPSTLAVCLAAVLLPGCRRVGRAGAPAPVAGLTPAVAVGCYVVGTGGRAGGAEPGEPPLDSTYRLRLAWPAPGGAADTAPPRGGPVTAYGADGRPLRPLRRSLGPRWTVPAEGGAVSVTLTDGFSGAGFVLSAAPGAPDTLRGRAYWYTDVGPARYDRGPAVAVRVPCPPDRVAPATGPPAA